MILLQHIAIPFLATVCLSCSESGSSTAEVGNSAVVATGGETLVSKSSGLELRLPQGDEQQLAQEDGLLVAVAIEQSGAIRVNEVLVDKDDLARIFRAARAKDEDVRVVFHGDSQVEHKDMLALIEIARAEGLNRFAIATRKNEDGGP